MDSKLTLEANYNDRFHGSSGDESDFSFAESRPLISEDCVEGEGRKKTTMLRHIISRIGQKTPGRSTLYEHKNEGLRQQDHQPDIKLPSSRSRAPILPLHRCLNKKALKSNSSCLKSVGKRLLVLSPVAVLMIFGILHLIQILLTHARLFWDVDINSDNVYNIWTQPGQPGNYLAKYPTDATRSVMPKPVHSHNDYWRRVPLYEALGYGCIGIEADPWLLPKATFDDNHPTSTIGGTNDAKAVDLYIGHTHDSLSRNRTLQSLYIDPLVKLLDSMQPSPQAASSQEAHINGVFDASPNQTLALLIDFKTPGTQAFSHVHAHLEPLRSKGYLTYFDGDKLVPGPITVMVTGVQAPFDQLLAMTPAHRDVFADAPLEQLYLPSQDADVVQLSPEAVSQRLGPQDAENRYNASNSYYASTSFKDVFGRPLRGELSTTELELMRGMIRGAKARGLKVRLFDTPVWPRDVRDRVWETIWREIDSVGAGEGVLNVDDVAAAAEGSWGRKGRVHEWW